MPTNARLSPEDTSAQSYNLCCRVAVCGSHVLGSSYWFWCAWVLYFLSCLVFGLFPSATIRFYDWQTIISGLIFLPSPLELGFFIYQTSFTRVTLIFLGFPHVFDITTRLLPWSSFSIIWQNLPMFPYQPFLLKFYTTFQTNLWKNASFLIPIFPIWSWSSVIFPFAQ